MTTNPVTQWTDIYTVDPNPYQQRAENPARAVEIAASIARQGLLQYPTGRWVEGRTGTSDGARVQLAAGHTRLAAFKLLHERDSVLLEQYPDLAIMDFGEYSHIPITIRPLTDEQLFEALVTENDQRDDLTPIEVAREMIIYRDHFGKSSREIGALFGLSDSAVRNKIRLLDLPEPVQNQLAAGELSEGTARRLLTLQRLAPRTVENMAKTIVDDGHITPEVVVNKIKEQLNKNKNAVKMWERWRTKQEDGTPRGGSDLFDFEWRPGPREIDPEKLAKKFQPDEIEILGDPPACKTCALYAVIDGDHYCGFKPCWEIKRDIWLYDQAGRISAETGILIYDPARDGKIFEEWERWSNGERFQKYWDEKAGHLRLRAHYSDYNHNEDATGNRHVRVVSVRPEYTEQVEQQKRERAERELKRSQEESGRELRDKRREPARAFINEIAAPIFAPAFECLNTQVFESLAQYLVNFGDAPDDPQQRAIYARVQVAGRLIREMFSWQNLGVGTPQIANHLENTARAWGIQLPPDWDTLTRQFTLPEDLAPESPVSTETPLEPETPDWLTA